MSSGPRTSHDERSEHEEELLRSLASFSSCP
jgi:hypothetical protein